MKIMNGQEPLPQTDTQKRKFSKRQIYQSQLYLHSTLARHSQPRPQVLATILKTERSRPTLNTRSTGLLPSSFEVFKAAPPRSTNVSAADIISPLTTTSTMILLVLRT